MVWQGKVAGVVGSAVLSFGIFATDAIHKLETNPTALYMAGQFWFMAGERECGLELIERAARTKDSSTQKVTERQVEANPQMCSREPIPAQGEDGSAPKAQAQPRLVATVAPAPSQPKFVRAAAAPTPVPGFVHVDLAPTVHVPSAPQIVAANFPSVDDFVASGVLVAHAGRPVIDPRLEERMREVAAQVERRANEHVKSMRRKALQEKFEQKLRERMQRS